MHKVSKVGKNQSLVSIVSKAVYGVAPETEKVTLIITEHNGLHYMKLTIADWYSTKRSFHAESKTWRCMEAT